MRPVTIGFLLTLASGAYIILNHPHLWFFAMTTSVWAGLAMVQDGAIGLLADKVRQKDALLALAKVTLDAANQALGAVIAEKEKEDA